VETLLEFVGCDELNFIGDKFLRKLYFKIIKLLMALLEGGNSKI
jgi:hypothetical protein